LCDLSPTLELDLPVNEELTGSHILGEEHENRDVKRE
jgi:hypothetical protein